MCMQGGCHQENMQPQVIAILNDKSWKHTQHLQQNWIVIIIVYKKNLTSILFIILLALYIWRQGQEITYEKTFSIDYIELYKRWWKKKEGEKGEEKKEEGEHG